MIKILHMADMHLDEPFSASGLGREQLLQRRIDLLENFKSIITLAGERRVDAMLIAGDLFEEEYVSVTTARRMLGLLAELAPMPVLISPGNHDPFHPGSPYATEELPDNLLLFREDSIKKIELPKLKMNIYGVAFNAPHENREIWKGFKVEKSAAGEINLILTHGAAYEGDASRADKFLPIAAEDLRNCGADYVALGHYHRGFDLLTDQNDGSVRAAYSGSPEPVRAEKKSTHGVIYLVVDPENRKTAVERIITQRRAHRRIELNLEGSENITEIDKKITETLADTGLSGNLVELVLIGRIPPDISIEPQAYANVARRCFAFSILDKTRPDYDLVALADEDTAKGAFCRLMMGRLEKSEGEDKELLEQALWLGLAAFDGQSVEEVPI